MAAITLGEPQGKFEPAPDVKVDVDPSVKCNASQQQCER